MDLERALVSKIITTGLLEEAVGNGVRADLFYDDECRDMFEYLSAHARQYRKTPSVAAVKVDRPGFEILYVEESLDWIIDKFIVLAKRRLANSMVVELAEACNDPARAAKIDAEFLEVSRKLATLIPSREVSRFSDMDKRIAEYEKAEKEGIKSGIPYGFPTLDDMTGGIHSHELVTIAGFSGLGKSTLSMVIAYNAWVQGYTPLIISLEMEASMMLQKFDAMAAGMSQRKMRQLELTSEQLDNWREFAQRVRKTTADIPIIDSIRNCTPDDVFAETIRHKPDLVVIDYITLMRSSSPSTRGTSMWQSVTEITQDLKQNARTLKTPIIAMAQTNRLGGKEGAELDNIGYSISVVQDSDVVIGLYADEEMRENKEMEIRVNKNRRGGLGKIRAVWDHENNDFREKSMNEMFQRKE